MYVWRLPGIRHARYVHSMRDHGANSRCCQVPFYGGGFRLFPFAGFRGDLVISVYSSVSLFESLSLSYYMIIIMNLSLSIYIHIYIYIYTYNYTHNYIHIYTYIHVRYTVFGEETESV